MKNTNIVRCAIYTRKSTEEGLDMEFNSLDAQRESGKNYIASQKEKRWFCLPTHYDDGGYSGGNVERPALKQLLADIKAGKIDIVVVYKIDRLSRSICDFVELCKFFDEYNVSFVSVTQDINTHTSAGRMMLNILVTFAQYEREIIGERIRDKVAASKRKGKYCGGTPPMGYIVDRENNAKKLVVEPAEAAKVKQIFELYTKTGSASEVAAQLNEAGLTTAQWTSRNGRVHPGKKFDTQKIYQILKNPIYVGIIRHGEHDYPGEHKAIISQDLWEEAQLLLQTNTVSSNRLAKHITPLQGLVYCGYCGKRMTENYTSKRKVAHYRYYICKVNSRHNQYCALRTVPIPELEKLVVREISKLFMSPTLVAGIQAKSQELTIDGKELSPEQIISALQNLQETWSNMFPVEQYQVIHMLISKITVFRDQVKIEYKIEGLEQIFKEAGAFVND